MIHTFAVVALVVLSTPESAQDRRPGYYIAEFDPAGIERLKPYSQQEQSTSGLWWTLCHSRWKSLEGEAAQGRSVMIAFDDVTQAHAGIRSDR